MMKSANEIRSEICRQIHNEICSEICNEIHSEICNEICSEIGGFLVKSGRFQEPNGLERSQ